MGPLAHARGSEKRSVPIPSRRSSETHLGGTGREEQRTVPARNVSGGRNQYHYRDGSLTVAARYRRIVGVVKDMHSRGLERSPMAQIYEAQAQSLDETENLVVRTDASAGVLRDTIRSMDNTAVLTDVSTL